MGKRQWAIRNRQEAMAISNRQWAKGQWAAFQFAKAFIIVSSSTPIIRWRESVTEKYREF
jgi:hypothetical protein